MYLVYILKSKQTGRYYIGFTSDIHKRLIAHNNGSNRSTKNGIPWEVIYSEQFVNRSDAWQREQQIKHYKGGEAFKKLIS